MQRFTSSSCDVTIYFVEYRDCHDEIEVFITS
jgi:hypothetical protein